jgi:hypothetical protein
MKILSIGVPLPGRSVDNHNIVNAPAFFDYDALILDPIAVSRTIEEVVGGGGDYRTGDDQLVGNLSATPLILGLDELLTSRRQQADLLLRRGGIIVVVIAPDLVHSEIAGLPGYRRFSLVPPPEGASWTQVLAPAYGRGCSSTTRYHPFAAYADYLGDAAAYHAFLVEDAVSPATVFARSPGGAAIGAEYRVDRGRVVFIPAPREQKAGIARAELANVLRQSILALAELQSAEAEPEWAAAQPLAGLEQLEAAEAEAEQALNEARSAHDSAVAARAAVTDVRRLLWAEGHALEEAVAVALGHLGFVRGDEDHLTVSDGKSVILVEAAASDSTVGLEAHHRLRARREQALETTGAMPGGLLVVSGYRDDPPGERPQQFDEALAVAAASQRYCLITGDQLFAAVSYALSAPGNEALAALRRRLIETEGLFEAPDGPATETEPVQPAVTSRSDD